jgi:preprotein translocase subunit YajC
MVDSLNRGDDIVTSGGIVGKVVRVLEDDKAEVEISENVTVKIIKSTVSQVLSKTEPKK